jgi:hypothetical protein
VFSCGSLLRTSAGKRGNSGIAGDSVVATAKKDGSSPSKRITDGIRNGPASRTGDRRFQ